MSKLVQLLEKISISEKEAFYKCALLDFRVAFVIIISSVS